MDIKLEGWPRDRARAFGAWPGSPLSSGIGEGASGGEDQGYRRCNGPEVSVLPVFTDSEGLVYLVCLGGSGSGR